MRVRPDTHERTRANSAFTINRGIVRGGGIGMQTLLEKAGTRVCVWALRASPVRQKTDERGEGQGGWWG